MISGAGYSDYAGYYLNQYSQTQETNRTKTPGDTAITVEQTQRGDRSTSQTDELTLSEDGLRMADMIGSSAAQRPSGPPPGGGPGGPPPSGAGENGISSEELEEEETAFYEELMAKLEEAGVETEEEIELGYDDQGNIVVTSEIDPEDKALIESILAEDDELAQSYQELTDKQNALAEMEAAFAQGPPPDMPQGGMQGMQNAGWMSGGQIANSSNVASMYAAQSTMSSNSIIVQAASST